MLSVTDDLTIAYGCEDNRDAIAVITSRNSKRVCLRRHWKDTSVDWNVGCRRIEYHIQQCNNIESKLISI